MLNQENKIIQICKTLSDKTDMFFEYEWRESLQKFELVCDNYEEYFHGTRFKLWRKILEKSNPNVKFYVVYKSDKR